MHYLARNRQLKAIFGSLSQRGGIKALGGLRSTISKLRGLNYTANKGLVDGIQLGPTGKKYISIFEPKTGSSGLIRAEHFSKKTQRNKILEIRKRFKR